MKPLTNNPIEGYQSEWNHLKNIRKRLDKGEKVKEEEINTCLLTLKAVSDLGADPSSLPMPGMGYMGKQVHKHLEDKIRIAKEDLENPEMFKHEDGFVWEIAAQKETEKVE